MPTRYHITLPDPSKARGADPALSFAANGADGFAEELQRALADPAWIGRWHQQQEDPDEVEEAVLATDPAARVTGAQRDLKIDLTAVTALPGTLLRHRMGLLAGNDWQLRDVTRA